MANLMRRMKRQDAVLWLFLREDHFGAKIYADPVQIKVRWEDKTEEFLDRSGNTTISRAQVFVENRIPERSVLWRGKMSEAVIVDGEDGSPNPFVNEGAYEVRQFAEQPDMKAKKFLRYVML
jgi:hypothetical protein